MGRIVILVIVGLGAIVLARAALDTALALPRIVAEARELAAW
jgi:hypothetical protein